MLVYLVSSSLRLDLYVDEKKLCYQELGFRRFNLITVFKALMSAITRRSLSEVCFHTLSLHLDGNDSRPRRLKRLTLPAI